MIKFVFKFVFLLFAAILTYNLFFGTPEEKEQSRKILAQTGEVGVACWNLLASEQEKFANGKYDKAFDTVKGALQDAADYAEKFVSEE